MKADTLSAQAPTAACGPAYSHMLVGDSAQRGHVPGAAVGPLCRLPPPGEALQHGSCVGGRGWPALSPSAARRRPTELGVRCACVRPHVHVGGCSCDCWRNAKPDCCSASLRIRSEELRFTSVQGEHHQRSAHLVVWIAAVGFVPHLDLWLAVVVCCTQGPLCQGTWC